MNPLNLITDAYDRQARLYPALLLVAPVVVTVVTSFSVHLTGVQSFGAVFAGFGGAFLLAQLARDAGKKKEKVLFEKWGGLPSVAIFRHRDTHLDSLTKTRYHRKLSKLVNEAKAPTVEHERTNPAAADAIYSAWSNFLRINTRDTKKFNLLFQENVSYGYRRNVWGLRPYGITASLVSLTTSSVHLLFVYVSTHKINASVGVAAAFAAILLLLWIFRFTADWVRAPANAYAERLAECTELLQGGGHSKRK